MPIIEFSVATDNGSVAIAVPDRKALIILGRNGTGKSALVHYINRQLRQNGVVDIVYLPGSRTSYFDGDSLNMTPNGRSQFETNSANWDNAPETRIRPVSGTSRNEKAIYDIQASELQYRVDAANQIEQEGIESSAIARLQSKSSPLNRVNLLLRQSNLPVQIIIEAGELRASRDGSTYSISKMSDGERTALIFIADVISSKSGSVFHIDEPELHLHRAIVVPLLSALLAERPDCTTIICTHELALANDHPDSPIIIVRGCTWNNSAPSTWDIEVLLDSENLPDDLRIDLLGSRQTILFVEGTSTSRDQPLYSILFPNASLRHRSTCADVRRAVVGLRQSEDYHHARAFGLVDNDGMDSNFQSKLLSEGIFALPLFAVESLYYAPELISAVALRQAEALNLDAEMLLAGAKAKALSTLRQSGKAEHLASRVAERQMRDKLLTQIPTRDDMIQSGSSLIKIDVESPYPTVFTRLLALIEANDLDSIVAGFPVRESGILDDIATSLRFISVVDYEREGLTAISANANLAEVMKSKLGPLVSELE